MKPTILSVIAAASQVYGIPADVLKSAVRVRKVAWPRQVAMVAVRNHCGTSYPSIGRAFGGRDHSTVKNAMKRVADRNCPDERAALQAIALMVSPDASKTKRRWMRGIFAALRII